MTNISWKVLTLFTENVNGNENYVVEIAFQVFGQDGDFTAVKHGLVIFNQDNNTSKDFTPYNELTEDIVISWIKNHFSKEEVDEFENDIIGQIEHEKNKANAIIRQGTPLPFGEQVQEEKV